MLEVHQDLSGLSLHIPVCMPCLQDMFAVLLLSGYDLSMSTA